MRSDFKCRDIVAFAGHAGDVYLVVNPEILEWSHGEPYEAFGSHGAPVAGDIDIPLRWLVEAYTVPQTTLERLGILVIPCDMKVVAGLEVELVDHPRGVAFGLLAQHRRGDKLFQLGEQDLRDALGKILTHEEILARRVLVLKLSPVPGYEPPE